MSSCPSTPGESDMSPDWTTSLKWKENEGSKLLTFMNWSKFCYPLSPCGYQFTLNFLGQKFWCEFKCYTWSRSRATSYYFTTHNFETKIQFNLWFNDLQFELKRVSPTFSGNKSANSILFCDLHAEKCFHFCIKSEDTFSNYICKCSC